MKIKTIAQLDLLLTEELTWRLKELKEVISNIQSAKDSINRKVSLRTGIALLYAHWEGFIKKSAEFYLNFVSLKGLNYIDLHPCFIALAAKKKIVEFSATNKASVYTQFFEFVTKDLSTKASIPYKDIISTQGNLSSNVLKEILHTIGLDYSPYELKAKLIDVKLVDARNHVAHGEHMEIDQSDFILVYDEITSLMREVKDRISNAASTDGFRKTV